MLSSWAHQMLRHLATVGCLVASFVFASTVPAGTPEGPLPMRPGSILGVAGFSGPHTLIEFLPSGEVLGSLTIADPDGLMLPPSGLAILDGDIWVGGHNNIVRIDPLTGLALVSIPASDSFNLTSLATADGFLWVGAIHPDRILKLTPDGQLQDTIFLQGDNLITGLDIVGSRFYISSYRTGHVHVFDMDGNELEVIETDLSAGNMSGVNFDPRDQTLWITIGTGTNEVLHFDLDANLLDSFPGPVVGLMGLEVLDASFFGDSFESGSTDAWSASSLP